MIYEFGAAFLFAIGVVCAYELLAHLFREESE